MTHPFDYFMKVMNRTPKGLPREQLVPGALVTISSNLRTGDNHLVPHIWQIIASNKGSVRIACGDFHQCVLIHEYEFWPAEHFVVENIKPWEPKYVGHS